MAELTDPYPGNELFFDFAKRNLTHEQYEAMIASSDGALQLVQDSSPALKAIGLYACDVLWKMYVDPKFIELVMSIVVSKNDPALVCTAVEILRRRLAGSNHRAAKTLLAGVVFDRSHTEHARATAYGALWVIVHGSDDRTNLSFEISNGLLELEKKPLQLGYIDWEFVKRHK